MCTAAAFRVYEAYAFGAHVYCDSIIVMELALDVPQPIITRFAVPGPICL